MRLPFICAGFAAAFAAGLFVDRLVPHADAQSGPAPLTPQIISLGTMTDEQIGPLIPNTDLRSRTLVATADGTVAVQSGNVFRHLHRDADEIQLVLDGVGSFWLGDQEHQIRAGDLIIIPRGTAHAGSRATTGRFRSLAIKLPPQRAGDTHPVP